jgi:Patatin-like phospholipase
VANNVAARLKPKQDGQRRMLALDGGGIRGLITLGILEKIEADLRQTSGKGDAFRLADYFDFIGGTSTGAIIATGLSVGLSVSDLLNFYQQSGPLMFQKEILFKRAWNKFKSDPLKDLLQQVLGAETQLGSDTIKTLLLIVTRNSSTDSPWPVTNNPLAKYNDRQRPDCNLLLPLWKLVRASTAAPTYFPPEVVEIGPREFVFVDGGVTPYNIPAFVMYRMAVSPPFKLEWATGESKMLIVSAGTGSAPRLGPTAQHPDRSIVETAASIAGEMMDGMAYDQDINCRTVGRCVFGPQLDREVGDLLGAGAADSERPERHFRYMRYDPDVSRVGLDALGLRNLDPEKVAPMDSIDAMEDFLKIGRRYAEQWLNTKQHFGPFFPQ